MKIHTFPQYSDEWWAARTAIPTASNLYRVLTEKKLHYSKAARSYASELIAERILGGPLEQIDGDTIWTERGTAMEDFAIKWYSFHYSVDVQPVGFVTKEVVRVDRTGEPIMDEDGELITDTFGGSPDGLVGENGLIEIKCRSAKHHARIMTGADADIANRLQTQGYLWLTGREWIDVVAFNPDLPKKIIRQYPEPDVQEMIEGQLQRFFREMALADRKLTELGDVIEEDESLAWELSESLKEGAPA